MRGGSGAQIFRRIFSPATPKGDFNLDQFLKKLVKFSIFFFPSPLWIPLKNFNLGGGSCACCRPPARPCSSPSCPRIGIRLRRRRVPRVGSTTGSAGPRCPDWCRTCGNGRKGGRRKRKNRNGLWRSRGRRSRRGRRRRQNPDPEPGPDTVRPVRAKV